MDIDFDISPSEVLNDVQIITPSAFTEARGSIWTSYRQDNLAGLLPGGLDFSHDKFSISKQNVLRGIHGDYKTWKLVSCISGTIFQVAVDLRETSESYLRWQGFWLGDDNRQMVLLPPGFGNAFYARTDGAVYHYKLAYDGAYSDFDEQFTVAWNDPRINIDWPVQAPILSERDQREADAKN